MAPRRWFAVIAVAVMMTTMGGVGGDIAKDRDECTDKLIGLSPCLPYVQDNAKGPTPDCCSGLKTVLQTSRKCLCVLIRDKDNPNLGLKIDVNKAISLPGMCNTPANISDCPKLLNLPPNSKEAQVFEQYAKALEGAQGRAPSAAGGGGAKAGASKSGAAAAVGPLKLRWLGVGGARAGVLSSIFSAAGPLAVPFLLLLG